MKDRLTLIFGLFSIITDNRFKRFIWLYSNSQLQRQRTSTHSWLSVMSVKARDIRLQSELRLPSALGVPDEESLPARVALIPGLPLRQTALVIHTTFYTHLIFAGCLSMISPSDIRQLVQNLYSALKRQHSPILWKKLPAKI